MFNKNHLFYAINGKNAKIIEIFSLFFENFVNLYIGGIMQITKQVNNNECGICILHSMIDYFHKKDIPHYELITKSNLTSDGLSIYDLEIIGLDYGLVFNSYNATIEELKLIDCRKYYILILNSDSRLHYVIAKNNRNKNSVTIYCSNRGQYEMTWKEFELEWSGIYISCEKSIFNNVQTMDKKEFIKVNWKYLLMMNCMSLITICISIFCGTFIQKITTLLIDDKYASISIALIFTYLCAYLSQFVLSWFCESIYKKTVFQNYQKLQYEMWLNTQLKHRTFFNKINYKYLIDMDDYSLILVDFYYGKLNQYIANAILLLVIIFILATIDSVILVFALGSILLSVGIDYISYKFQRENWDPAQNESNDYKNSLISLIDFQKNNNYYNHETKLFNKTKHLHSKLKNRYYKTNHFNQIVTFIDSVVQIVFFILIAFFGIKLVIDNKLNIGQLLFCITLTQMITSSVKTLCQLPNNYVEFKHARTIVNNILNVDNLSNDVSLINDIKVNVITYKNFIFNNDTVLIGRSGIGKSYCLMRIANLINGQEEILFNENKQKSMNDMWFKKNCIYLNQIPHLIENSLIELFNNIEHREIIIKCLYAAKIDNDKIDNLSTGQKQILCLLGLLKERNKVILLDESLSNVDNELKINILKLIKPILIENNLLIYVDHNINCHKLFSEKVNFNE